MSELAPGLLIAAPPLGDPHFERSVVLLASHDREGAFGWVLNGPHVMSVAELLVRAEVTEERVSVPGLVRFGGPVSQSRIWLVYPAASRVAGVEGQFEVSSGVMATASRGVLERIAAGVCVPGLAGFAGYAGWGEGQLEREIRGGAWLPSDVEPSLVFDVPAEELWEHAYRRMGTSPIAFVTRTVGSA